MTDDGFTNRCPHPLDRIFDMLVETNVPSTMLTEIIQIASDHASDRYDAGYRDGVDSWEDFLEGTDSTSSGD